MTVIREGYSEEMLKVVFEHVASGSCTTCCDTCSKNVLLVECLKRPGVENMAFRTNPFFTGNEFSEKKHTLLH